MTVTLEITTEVGTKGKSSLNKVKNYTISTPAQIKQFATAVNAGNALEGETIIQLADINLNGSENNQWTPINGFKGNFTGNKNTIKNVYIDSNENETGFFGSITGTGSVKEIELENVTIKGKVNTGGIVGDIRVNAYVSYCYSIGNIEATGNISRNITMWRNCSRSLWKYL